MHSRRFAGRVCALFSLALSFGAASALTLGTEGTAQAQEIQLTGPLKGAPAARHLRLYREGRFELAPTIGFTLLDEYRRTILPGARLAYNITDYLSLGVWGGVGAVSTTTDLTDQINSIAPRDQRTAINVNRGNFADQTAKISWIAAPQVQFAPFRGKLAIFQKVFVDTDAYLHAGLAFVGLQERGDCTACTAQASFALASRTAIAPTFGLGLSFYTSDFISLGVEYRALPFSWNRAGFDSRGAGNNNKFPDNKIDSQDQTFKFNQMIVIALGFSFPTTPRISD